MSEIIVKKTYEEINAKIKKGTAVVVTAEEMTSIVKSEGYKSAFQKVDVVTTGTFGTMCSSGAFINFGHTRPKIKASKVWLNDVEAYAGLAAVDIYIGATQVQEDDPLNKVHPGRFKYGGGHVIEDLIAGRPVKLKAKSYGTDCYPYENMKQLSPYMTFVMHFCTIHAMPIKTITVQLINPEKPYTPIWEYCAPIWAMQPIQVPDN